VESDIVGAILILAFPVGAIIFGYFSLRKPEKRAAYERRNAGKNPFGADSWGP